MSFREMVRRTASLLPAALRGPGLLAVLLVCVGSAQAGYVSCPVMQEINEFNAFLGDFFRWNAQNENMPLLALELTPPAEQGNMLLMLWWMWMLNPDLPPSPLPPGSGYSPSLPVTPIVGPVGLPPPLPSGGSGPLNPPGNGGNGSWNPPGNGGSGSSLDGPGNDPPPGPGNGYGGGSSDGSPSPQLGVPAPSALLLAAWGAFGLLIARRRRGLQRRTSPERP